MDYIRAADILPQELLEELQQYVDDAMLYIPKKAEGKKDWGKDTAAKMEFAKRNSKIYEDFLAGRNIRELSEKYFLVEKSIQRIIRQEKLKKEESEL